MISEGDTMNFSPIHLAANYPGVASPIAMINGVKAFLDWVQQFNNVYVVTNQQLLAWMQVRAL
jgi:hypothetical protein